VQYSLHAEGGYTLYGELTQSEWLAREQTFRRARTVKFLSDCFKASSSSLIIRSTLSAEGKSFAGCIAFSTRIRMKVLRRSLSMCKLK